MFEDASSAVPALPLATLPSLRDLGGFPARDGTRVRSGILYRSGALAQLAGDDVAAFARLGVRTVFDLRTADERRAEPERLPLGVETVVVDVLAEAADPAPGELVTSPGARAAHQRLFVDLARPRHRPALIHGTGGVRRTGWAAAAMLLILGVTEDEVLRDGDPALLEVELRALRSQFGTIERYFSDGLGIGPADQRALREIFTEPAA